VPYSSVYWTGKLLAYISKLFYIDNVSVENPTLVVDLMGNIQISDHPSDLLSTCKWRYSNKSLIFVFKNCTEKRRFTGNKNESL
jgi:hypothetical protein